MTQSKFNGVYLPIATVVAILLAVITFVYGEINQLKESDTELMLSIQQTLSEVKHLRIDVNQHIDADRVKTPADVREVLRTK